MNIPSLSEDQFWQIIESAKNDPFLSADPEDLKRVLSKLSDQQIISFGVTFNEKLCELNSWHLWGAGFVISQGMGDDSFHYFRSWIIGQGRESFEVAIRRPDDLGTLVKNKESIENEELEYVTLDILESRGVDQDPRDLCTRFPDDEPHGEPFSEDNLSTQFPKLTSQFT